MYVCTTIPLFIFVDDTCQPDAATCVTEVSTIICINSIYVRIYVATVHI